MNAEIIVLGRVFMLCKFRRFCATPFFLLIILLISMIGILGGSWALLPSMIFLVQIVALLLFVCDDLLPAFLPVFCIITLGATNLASLNDFVPYIPVTVTVVAGLIFHLIRYRRPLYIGKSLYGLVATSIAILLSGMATPLSSRDYSSLAAIYHVVGLSVGLILLYFLFASNRRENREYDPIKFFLLSMFFLGLLSSVVIFSEFLGWFIPHREEILSDAPFWATEYLNTFTYRNTIAPLLVMCFPSAFYLAKTMKRVVSQLLFLLFGIFFFIMLILSAARTAWICGTLLLFIYLAYYLHKNPRRVGKYLCTLLIFAGALILLQLFREPLSSIALSRISKGFIRDDEPRLQSLSRSVQDFLAHPLFGIGISSTANADIYSAPGCISWYHMYFPQLWGSMGLLGVGTYMYQLVIRAKLILTKPTAESTALGFVYLGLFLYSQTDVGEFTPIPFVVIALIVFVLLEDKVRRLSKS